jgi:riboflavin synthase
MFTGIIQAIGTVKSFNDENLEIITESDIFYGHELGTSISIDGVCLTLSDYDNKILKFQVSQETVNRSVISNYEKGSIVNLELPLTMDKFLSGHLVQGHVDTTTSVLNIEKVSDDLWDYQFSTNNSNYLVDKGSITINGVSLTVVSPDEEKFSVSVIRETFNRTNFNKLQVGSLVNVEFDIMAKYVERFLDDK